MIMFRKLKDWLGKIATDTGNLLASLLSAARLVPYRVTTRNAAGKRLAGSTYE